ncbi:ribosomal protein L22, partial [Trifolium medium]|nr:ribosomal protein L22 [Trifolium medium]
EQPNEIKTEGSKQEHGALWRSTGLAQRCSKEVVGLEQEEYRGFGICKLRATTVWSLQNLCINSAKISYKGFNFVQESNKSYAEAYAVGRHIRMSADKARRVIDQIRGRPYEETLMILELMPYRACEAIIKIVFSAGANASNNLGLSKSSLVISKAEVNEGKTLKRVRARAQGRANQILKRTCHITITVKGLPSESVVEANPS